MPLRATLFWLTLAATAQAEPTRRFGLFVGNNEGGESTRPLLYARDDAQRLREIFSRLGGVSADDSMLLLDESTEDVLTALGELERRARDARTRGERTALFFYYSGHAKDGALRLGSSKLPLEALKSRLASGPTDIRVAVFDACRSGVMTRTKGVRRAPAFEVETDATRAAKGLVILTSSASDEDSQESDLIGASYFSYHLATGLLGSADSSQDGRVSLGEAYAYAYERTVASTADSAAGPQHPTFSFDLAGNGDLMLTDVVERREGVRFGPRTEPGTYIVVDTRGVVVAETVKAGTDRIIALSPGAYVVKRRLSDHLRIASVQVVGGTITDLDEAAFKKARFSDDPVKGTGISSIYSRHWSVAAVGSYQTVFDRPALLGPYFPNAPMVGGALTMHNVFGRGFGLTVDVGYGWATGTLSSSLVGTLTYAYTLVNVGGAVLYEWGEGNRFVPFGGVHVSLNLMTRTFLDAPVAVPKNSYSVVTPGLIAGLKIRLTDRFSVIAHARVHYLLYNVDETRNLGTADFGVMLDYEFRE